MTTTEEALAEFKAASAPAGRSGTSRAPLMAV